MENTSEYPEKNIIWIMGHFADCNRYIRSIVDFNCGNGAYLLGAYKRHQFIKDGRNDIMTLKGYSNEQCEIDSRIKSFVEHKDCTSNLNDTTKYRVVLALDISDDSKQLVENIYNACADDGFILFSSTLLNRDEWLKIFFEISGHEMYLPELEKGRIAKRWKEQGTPNHIIDNLILFHKSKTTRIY